MGAKCFVIRSNKEPPLLSGIMTKAFVHFRQSFKRIRQKLLHNALKAFTKTHKSFYEN